MTPEMLARALRGYAQRRPFRPFLIEFTSGDRLLVSHPEAVERQGDLFVFRGPDRRHHVFAGTGVSRLLDPPPA